MNRLEETTIGELQRALDDVDGKKPAQRLIAAIAYKNGVTQTELAEWFDVERKTIYNWLTRLEGAPLDEAAGDSHRSGRRQKLSEDQLEEFERTVTGSPREAGYDEPAWTTDLVRRHLEEVYGVKYSLPSCRRLLRQAGLRYRRSRRSNGEVNPGDSEGSKEVGSGGRWVLQ